MVGPDTRTLGAKRRADRAPRPAGRSLERPAHKPQDAFMFEAMLAKVVDN